MDATDEASARLERERDACVLVIRELMSGWGLRLQSTPPQLLEALTRYGMACVDIGQRFVHFKETIPPTTRAPAQGGGWEDDSTKLTPVLWHKRKSGDQKP